MHIINLLIHNGVCNHKKTASKAVEVMKQKTKGSIDPVPIIYQQQLQEVSAR